MLSEPSQWFPKAFLILSVECAILFLTFSFRLQVNLQIFPSNKCPHAEKSCESITMEAEEREEKERKMTTSNGLFSLSVFTSECCVTGECPSRHLSFPGGHQPPFTSLLK